MQELTERSVSSCASGCTYWFQYLHSLELHPYVTAASDVIGRIKATTYIRWTTWNSLKINAKRKWFQSFTA